MGVYYIRLEISPYEYNYTAPIAKSERPPNQNWLNKMTFLHLVSETGQLQKKIKDRGDGGRDGISEKRWASRSTYIYIVI